MGLAERMEAARLIGKYKALLLKELPNSQARLTRWDNLMDEANNKKNALAANQARDCLRAASRYDTLLNKLAGFIKRVSLLRDDSVKIGDFIGNMKTNGNLANRAYRDYVFEKELFWSLFGKGDWDDRLIRWVNEDHPNWDAAIRIFKEFSRMSVTIS